MAVTKKQLASLKKARAARKRNLAKKKARKSSPKKRRTVKKRKSPAKKRARRSSAKRRTRRNPTKRTTLEYFIFFQKGKRGTKYYLQKIAGKWQLDSNKPAGMGEKLKADAMRVGKRMIKRVPAGHNLYLDVKKKRA